MTIVTYPRWLLSHIQDEYCHISKMTIVTYPRWLLSHIQDDYCHISKMTSITYPRWLLSHIRNKYCHASKVRLLSHIQDEYCHIVFVHQRWLLSHIQDDYCHTSEMSVVTHLKWVLSHMWCTCYTRAWVLSHIRNENCHTSKVRLLSFIWDMYSHIPDMSIVTHLKWVPSHIWMSVLRTFMSIFRHLNETCHTYDGIVSKTKMKCVLFVSLFWIFDFLLSFFFGGTARADGGRGRECRGVLLCGSGYLMIFLSFFLSPFSFFLSFFRLFFLSLFAEEAQRVEACFNVAPEYIIFFFSPILCGLLFLCRFFLFLPLFFPPLSPFLVTSKTYCEVTLYTIEIEI